MSKKPTKKQCEARKRNFDMFRLMGALVAIKDIRRNGNLCADSLRLLREAANITATAIVADRLHYANTKKRT